MRTPSYPILLASMLAWGGPARADTTALQVYGPGTVSCATYLQDRSLRINADGWILGFWTGMNFEDTANQLVGKSTDSRGIVGATAQFCRNAPATPLYKAVREVYQNMKNAGS